MAGGPFACAFDDVAPILAQAGARVHRVADAAHNVPQELPEDFAGVVIRVCEQIT
jgi:pimeloyl-ACP methyl ester carboxylesterase